MIRRTHRFHGHNALRHVYQNGKTIRSQLCSLRFMANPRRQEYRLAVVVSKKVSKSAVVRNRIRRRLYEAIRLRSANLNGHDLVVTAFSENLATIPSKDLDNAVVAMLEQAGLM